jgi:hypothetical protein
MIPDTHYKYFRKAMKTATVKELNQELNLRNPKELLALCLRLSKFKKENKELLTYLLFESSDETSYIESVRREIDKQFELINRKTQSSFKKSIWRILRNTRKYIRYSQKKQTEIDLLIYFCIKLKKVSPSIQKHSALVNLYNRQLAEIAKKVSFLHEDLQYDYGMELNELKFT